jgi:hypothetical protein
METSAGCFTSAARASSYRCCPNEWEFVRGIDLEGPLVDYQRKGHRARLLDPDSVEGIAAWSVEVTTPDGTILHLFVDAERVLEIKALPIEPGRSVDLETTFSDYKVVSVLLVPHRFESALGGNLRIAPPSIASRLNVPIDEAEFEKPKAGSP